jgi:hypothetical protein
MNGYALTPPVRHIALIGNFPPRRCGIATFTADLHDALRQISPDASLSTVAMNDPGTRHRYPEEVGYEIAQDDPDACLAAADHLNALNRTSSAFSMNLASSVGRQAATCCRCSRGFERRS